MERAQAAQALPFPLGRKRKQKGPFARHFGSRKIELALPWPPDSAQRRQLRKRSEAMLLCALFLLLDLINKLRPCAIARPRLFTAKMINSIFIPVLPASPFPDGGCAALPKPPCASCRAAHNGSWAAPQGTCRSREEWNRGKTWRNGMAQKTDPP